MRWLKRRKPRLLVFPVAKTNPYQNALYCAFDDAVDVDLFKQRKNYANLGRACRRADAIHFHWEEGVFWGCRDLAAAELRHDRVRAALEAFKARSGRVMWTVHNAKTHGSSDFYDPAARMREFMRETADLVHVHSQAAFDLAGNALQIDTSRLILVPHPSYLGVYPGLEDIRHAPKPAGQARFLFFGTLRDYKGLDALLQAFSADEIAGVTARLIVAGSGTDAVQARLSGALAHLGERLDLRIGYVPSEDIASLFGAADFVVLPYEHGLTSGVALLALSCGIPVIAPRLGGLPEAVTEENMSLLYDPDDTQGFRRALRQAAALEPDRHAELVAASRRMAADLDPKIQSANLLKAMRDRGLF